VQYVSFPVQTLFKSSKIIPVMLMGRLLKNTKYPLSQYFEAALITLGVYIFSSYSKEGREGSTELYGILCLCVYICSDSFTSQWQSRIYQKYGKPNVDQYQMMLGVNSFSILFTVIALVTSGDIPRILEFLRENSVCFRYNIITAVCSASGQLFIFYTIKVSEQQAKRASNTIQYTICD
jgi:adenosine 3'-phospho 5'-phosphosulfate transporter B2|tara:strand:+ start:139 stop:675 length:537 start_codon:yes stop_codon:yes gene_type:complete